MIKIIYFHIKMKKKTKILKEFLNCFTTYNITEIKYETFISLN